MLIVQKFGGSSLAGLERLKASAEICARTWRDGHQTVAAVSAMGKSTDELLNIAHRICESPAERELDALLATGEQKSAALMALMLESMGIPACSFTGAQAGIYTDLRHGEARIEFTDPRRLHLALEEGRLPVVAGFQGLNSRGDISTLGRGGSDTTAVAIANALKADKCEIYTDVSGIYTADPRLVPEAVALPEIDFRDMLLLAGAGSQVLHSRSVELAMNNGVKLLLLSSFEAGEGSSVQYLPDERRSPYAGVTRNSAANTVTLVGKKAGDGSLQQLKARLKESGIAVLAETVGKGCVSVKTDPSQLLSALRIAHSLVLTE